MKTTTPVAPAEPPSPDEASAVPMRVLPLFIPALGAVLLLLTGLVWSLAL